MICGKSAGAFLAAVSAMYIVVTGASALPFWSVIEIRGFVSALRARLNGIDLKKISEIRSAMLNAQSHREIIDA